MTDAKDQEKAQPQNWPFPVPPQSMTLDDLEAALQHAGDAEEYWKGINKQLAAEIGRRFKEQAVAAVRAKDDPFGSATLDLGAFILKADLPKKVEWDQQKLHAIAGVIRGEWNEDPAQYIDTDLSISEKTFKAWPETLQAKFADARTTKEGTLKLSLERKQP